MSAPKKKTLLGGNAAPTSTNEPVETAYKDAAAAPVELDDNKAADEGSAGDVLMDVSPAWLPQPPTDVPSAHLPQPDENTDFGELHADDLPFLIQNAENPLLLVRYTDVRSREIGYGTDGSAGIDLRAYMTGCRNRGTRLSAGTVTKFGTGVAVAIPEGHVGLIIMRSGKSANDGIQLANQVAVIDSDYRGEIMLPLTTDRTEGAFVDNGERVAQLVIVPCKQMNIVRVDSLEGRNGTQKLGYLEIMRPDQIEVHITQELPETDRGTGGFGSTGRS